MSCLFPATGLLSFPPIPVWYSHSVCWALLSLCPCTCLCRAPSGLEKSLGGIPFRVGAGASSPDPLPTWDGGGPSSFLQGCAYPQYPFGWLQMGPGIFRAVLRLSVCWEHEGIVNFFSKGRSKPRSLKDEWTQKTSPFPGSSEFASLPVKRQWQGCGQWSQETRKYKPWCFCPPAKEVGCPVAFLCLQLKTLT